MQDAEAELSVRELAFIDKARSMRSTPPNTPPKKQKPQQPEHQTLKRRELPKTKTELPMPSSTPLPSSNRRLPKIGICLGSIVFIILFMMILFDPID